MLRIGKLTDYAMLIMSHMAKESSSVQSAAFLADALHLSVPTVSKILKILSDAGLVRSTRGAIGGYCLARPAESITLAEVIASMEGELAMTECCESTPSCALESLCTVRGNWRTINKMIHSLLTAYTISDLLQPLTIKKVI